MNKKSSLGMDENVAGLLSYLFGWVSGLIFFLTEKESKFVKFHALQSLITSGGIGVLSIVLFIVFFLLQIVFINVAGMYSIAGILGGLSFLVWGVVFIASLFFWILGMVKAYNNEMYKFPVIGNIVEKQLNK